MHQDDIKDEQQVAEMKAAINAVLIPDARMTMKTYALLEAASDLCKSAIDLQFLEEAFSEVVNRRPN